MLAGTARVAPGYRAMLTPATMSHARLKSGHKCAFSLGGPETCSASQRGWCHVDVAALDYESLPWRGPMSLMRFPRGNITGIETSPASSGWARMRSGSAHGTCRLGRLQGFLTRVSLGHPSLGVRTIRSVFTRFTMACCTGPPLRCRGAHIMDFQSLRAAFLAAHGTFKRRSSNVPGTKAESTT